MKIEKRLLVVEIVGLAAVAASLVFVGLQMNQAQEIARATMRLEITAAQHEVAALIADFPQVIAIMEGEQAPASVAEYWRAWIILRAGIRGYENQVYQYRHGFLDESEWQGIRREIAFRLSQPFSRKIWEETQEVFSPDFRAMVNGLLKEG